MVLMLLEPYEFSSSGGVNGHSRRISSQRQIFIHFSAEVSLSCFAVRPYIFLPEANLWASVKIHPSSKSGSKQEAKSVNFWDKLSKFECSKCAVLLIFGANCQQAMTLSFSSNDISFDFIFVCIEKIVEFSKLTANSRFLSAGGALNESVCNAQKV